MAPLALHPFHTNTQGLQNFTSAHFLWLVFLCFQGFIDLEWPTPVIGWKTLIKRGQKNEWDFRLVKPQKTQAWSPVPEKTNGLSWDDQPSPTIWARHLLEEKAETISFLPVIGHGPWLKGSECRTVELSLTVWLPNDPACCELRPGKTIGDLCGKGWVDRQGLGISAKRKTKNLDLSGMICR